MIFGALGIENIDFFPVQATWPGSYFSVPGLCPFSRILKSPGLVFPYRRTLQPISVKSVGGYTDKGHVWVRGALVDIRFGRFGPCRYTLWPIRALSIYPLADSCLVDTPFGRLWPCPGGTGRLFLNSGFLRRPSRDSGYLGLCRVGFWLLLGAF